LLRLAWEDDKAAELFLLQVRCVLKLLHDSLTELHMQRKEGGRSLTVKEMESVASIIEKLDKIVRLEKGSPTEIISKTGLSVEEARQIIKNDPFAPKTVEAEVISVSTPEEDILG
jgi:hypothetical protein